ncbi:uncharacterized protein I303_108584 [Kwoniella dejecticola CBS 10117]|uniref:Major facilitator superfamily (MFS) profile domain-containing protein n=1 Tax=Kwoniella dejecticola CBS 10117 TaxID=1296121 RepID=A0A1A5ZWZ5_9TREE|nr:uncharacterized protein I303_07091 [Kwoniella dejecticola CBS 10117]OBR82332.1 hypothetical protein I303_07091 [Kwoniella dejecticola CBS 10117]
MGGRAGLSAEPSTQHGSDGIADGVSGDSLDSPRPPFADEDRRRKGSDATVGSSGGSTREKKKGKGLTEGDEDVPDLPNNNLKLVMPAIGLVLFLSALDQTIVATALPTIAEDLKASPSEYSWVGTSYLLASTLQTPINGRVSDIIGRKPMLYAAIIIFTIFSALCGAAKSASWLIIARAFQGLGGGSIIGLTGADSSAADIVPLHKRGTYQGFLGSAWGIAAVLGPILGGLLTEKASWRWCFYINLPTCGIAFALLVFTLKLNPSRKLTFAELNRTFDFLGLALLMAASALLIVGFSRAADFGFGQPATYGVIIAGAVVFLAAIANFLTTKRNAIIPARMFKNRTTAFFLLASTLHAATFLAFNYLLPELLQGLRGDSPIDSGVHLLPFACCVAWMTVVAGQLNSRLRIVRPVAWAGYALAVVAWGLFYGLFKSTVKLGTLEGVLVIGGIGTGLSLQVPMLIIQAAMPLKEMAAATSAWSLTRNMGGSIGLAVYTAILNTNLRSRFVTIEGYGTSFTVPESASGYKALHELPEGPMKDQVLSAFADSFRVCWIVGCAFFAAALLITIPTRSYSLNRARGGQAPTIQPPTDDVDVEAQNGHNQDRDQDQDEKAQERREERDLDPPIGSSASSDRTATDLGEETEISRKGKSAE